jgi:hypothetical protein
MSLSNKIIIQLINIIIFEKEAQSVEKKLSEALHGVLAQRPKIGYLAIHPYWTKVCK